MTPTLASLETLDKPLFALSNGLSSALGSRLRKVILFGSRARGDHGLYSDYDVLVVVNELTPEIENAIDDVAGEVLVTYDAVISAFSMDEQAFGSRRGPFLRNIRREGRLI